MLYSFDEGQVQPQIAAYLHAHHGEHGRTLQIQVENGAVVLRGCAKTYHQKQLWLHGALQVAGPGRVIDEIEVST